MLENGTFYQTNYDGTEVAIIADYPGLLPESLLMDINPSTYNRNGRGLSRGSIIPPHSPRITTGILTPDSKRIRIYLWSSRREYFTRRAMTAPKWPSLPIIPVFSLLHT